MKREVLIKFGKKVRAERIKTKSGAMRARVALARKLLTIMWHMMNKGQDYVAY